MGVGALFADEEAVGPVIGVILMMAIAVILAAVIDAFALGFSDIDPTS
jgi:flagellin-like protein